MSILNKYFNLRINPYTGAIMPKQIIAGSLTSDYPYITTPNSYNAPLDNPQWLEIELPETPDLTDTINRPFKLYKNSIAPANLLIETNETNPVYMPPNSYKLPLNNTERQHCIMLSPNLFNTNIYYDYYGLGTVVNASNLQNFISSLIKTTNLNVDNLLTSVNMNITNATITNLTATNLTNNQMNPIGSIIMWSMNTPPINYFECNGSLRNISDYPELYAVIGKYYGGNATQFRLPDLRGYFIRGRSDGEPNMIDPDRNTRMKVSDPNATMLPGDNVGTIQQDEIISHNHPTNAHRIDNRNNVLDTTTGGIDVCENYSNSTTSNAGGAETRPKNVYLMYCIRYR